MTAKLLAVRTHLRSLLGSAMRIATQLLPSAQEVKGRANRLAVGRGKNPAKQHIGFRLDSLQSNGSGLIGTGHTSAGENTLPTTPPPHPGQKYTNMPKKKTRGG